MDEDTNKKIEDMVKENKVFLFMKGTPDMPMCGFSFRVSRLLKDLNVEFESFNVLNDHSIREGIKEYTNWPTIPQLYINGTFIGGCEIIEELFHSGELEKIFHA